MSFSTDWDVNYYKTEYESEEHWELRKAFIEAHKDKFPEAEIVCLAQVFTNIEFLGCRYPEKTMLKVAHLSKEVADSFRKSRANKIKRTFVGASDAAGAKAKGRSSQMPATQSINQNICKTSKIPSLQSTFQKAQPSEHQNTSDTIASGITYPNKRKSALDNNDDYDDDDDGTEMQRSCFSMSSSTSKKPTIVEPTASVSQPAFSRATQMYSKRLPDTGFIIYESMSKQQQCICILEMSAAKQKAVVKFDTEVSKTNPNGMDGVVRINNIVYATVPITSSKKEAKTQAFNVALEYARKINYTIRQKEVNHTVSVAQQEVNDKSADEKNKAQPQELSADNKGFKMMKMLGWSGGALGISGNGIEQPISIEMKIDRSGLGLSSDCDESKKLNYDFFVQYLTKYKTDETATYDLVFSEGFSKGERKTLHEIANRLSLKSRSHNKADGSRYMVVHKKQDLMTLANEILNNGLRAKYYELIPPTDPLPPRETPLPISKPAQQQTNTFGFNYKNLNQNRRQNWQQQRLNKKRPKFAM